MSTTDFTPVQEKLAEFGITEEAVVEAIKNLGVTTLDDLAALTEGDLTKAGAKLIPARKLVAALAKPAVDTTVAAAVTFDGILPTVPDDGSWLNALKTGGVLKVDQSTVISAIRAALANRVGLYDLPTKLVRAMEEFADTNEQPVDAQFFALRKQIARRTYAEVFEAVDGLDGTFVTEGRKKQLFERIDERLWPAIIEFFQQLKSWQEAWMTGATNPAILMMTMMSGGRGAALPPGMMQAPETGILRDQAGAVADAINRVFAGTGIQIASALAYDAAQIKKVLEDPRLPSLIGAANREQMLKMLGAAVSPTYPRLETNLTRFVLATMQANDQAAGDEELQYFGALYMLGSQIPWETLGGRMRVTGLGGGRVQL